jgi:hypothetical protein
LGLRDVYRDWFEPKSQDKDARLKAISDADDLLLLWGNKTFRDIVDKIEKMALAPIQSSHDAYGLAQAVGESNGIKKIISMLKQDLARARRIQAETREQIEE